MTSNVFSHRHARKAATSLDRLTFVELREPLARIAAGNGSREDIAIIDKFMTESAISIEENIDYLNSYKDTFREQFGLEMSLSYRELLIGKSQLASTLRGSCRHFIITASTDPHHALVDEYIKNFAAHLLKRIDRLNKTLASCHDAILPPKQKIPKAKRSSTRRNAAQ